MRKTLFIGYGNPLRNDDGIGWHIISILQERYSDSAIEFITEHQLAPELADTISQFKLIVLIDAAAEGIPGEVRRKNIQPAEDNRAAFTHHVNPQILLTMTKQFYDAEPEMVLFTICGEDFGHGENISSTVRASIPSLMQEIEELLDFLNNDSLPEGEGR